MYQKVVPRVRGKTCSQLSTEIDKAMEMTMPQQLDMLLPTVLKLDKQISLDLAQKHSISSLERNAAEMIENVAFTIIKVLLLHLRVCTQKRMLGRVQNPVTS